jgi:hypothetical protein
MGLRASLDHWPKIQLPSRDVTAKLSLGGNSDVITELFLSSGSLVSDIPAGDGKLVILFLRCDKLLKGCTLPPVVKICARLAGKLCQ